MNFDIVVVGASSAGLYAAGALARYGKRVAVFDRSKGIKPEQRTYIITPSLHQVIHDIPKSIIQQDIYSIRIHSGQNQADIQLSSPDLIIDRADLISLLATRAEDAGVTLIDSCEFLGFEIKQGKTLVKVRKDDSTRLVTTDFLIGADGVHSTVRKSIGFVPIPSVPLLQAVVDLPPGWDPGMTAVWFDVEDTPYFYWLIPHRNNQAVVGLISEQGANIQELLDRFLSQHNFMPLSFQSGQTALHSKKHPRFLSVGDLCVWLVGDAAGQVKVTTVGGTVTGIEGAREAARMIQGIRDQESRSKVRRELDLHVFIRNLLNHMASRDYDDLIDMLNPTVINFLSHHDRDNMRSHFWKLALIQPRFIPLGLKLLSRSLFNYSV